MLDMALNSITLFLKGRLFADSSKVYRQIAIGTVVTAATLLAIALAGAPIWLAALVAGFAGGALQPHLFKDLKYR
jgi:uncharacterized membrane protein